jgi:condensin complex subunit 3
VLSLHLLCNTSHTPHSEDLYISLRSSLLDRIHDKEPTIRVQAVIALSKLSASEDPADVEEGESTIIEVLVDTVSHDPAVYVKFLSLEPPI